MKPPRIIESKVFCAKPSYEYLLEWFPLYDYHRCREPERLEYTRTDNITGHQQRCFAVYWALKCAEKGGVGIDMGCGQAISPFCIGVDKYSGDDHPDYGGAYHPHLELRADKPLPFTDGCFDFLISHHSLEHMNDAEWTLREWIRIVKPNGILAIVMPDGKYPGTDNDKDHKRVYTAEEFKEEVLDSLVGESLVKVIEYDTFDNCFSFNCVLKKC